MELDLTVADLLSLIAVLLAGGFLTGIVAGLLGIGGGGVLVPMLFEVFGAVGVEETVRMHLAVGTSLTIIIPTSIRSFLSHRGKGAVDMGVVRSMALPVVIGVGVGIVVAGYSGGWVLKTVWIVFPLILASKLFFGDESWRLGDEIPGRLFRAIYGGIVGLISALMSIGGGAFITAMMTLYGRTIHQGVATSSGFGPLVAIPGALGFIWAGWQVAGLPPASLGYVSLIGAGIVIPASVAAAPLGVRIAHGISRRKLELAFATFLTVVALRFLVNLAL